MAITNERFEMLSTYLASDKDRTEHLLALSPQEAKDKINADGNDFSLEEIEEFGKQLQLIPADNKELNVTELDDVIGGSISLGTAALCVVGGIIVGVACNISW